MKIVYKDLQFPFESTNLERIIDGKYFKINLHDGSQEIHVHLDNERMLLEFSKNLKRDCSYLKDFENTAYVETIIDLEKFVQHFNEGYKLNATIQ